MDNDQANLGNGGNSDQGNIGTNNPPAWTAQLDGDLQKNERLTQFKTIGEMGRAFLDTEGKLKGTIAIPGEGATDAERAEFYTKLGRPETADKYSITKPSELPEDIPYSPDIEEAFKQIAYEKGLSDSAAKDIYNWYWELAKSGHAQQLKADSEATEAAINTLKDQWKGDTFVTNTELAKRAFSKFGGETPEIKDFIENTKIKGVSLGNHPLFLKVFSEIGKAISDDSMNAGGRGGTGGELSDEEKAKARFPATKFK